MNQNDPENNRYCVVFENATPDATLTVTTELAPSVLLLMVP